MRSERGKQLFDEIRRELRAFIDTESRLLRDRRADAQNGTWLAVGGYIALLLGVSGLIAWAGRRDITNLSSECAGALARMRESGRESEERAWLRGAQLELANQLAGELAARGIAERTLAFLAERCGAIKFTERGEVTLRVEPRASGIAFVVKDTGIGIPASQQRRVFEAFKQGDGALNRRYGGTGLGLSISRQLAGLLGGDIELSSVEGHRLALPVHEPRDKEPVQAGHVYVASADYHLLIEADRRFAFSNEPPVSYARPSIDVLMASAADAYGPALAGVLLTGANRDGAEGMAAIHACGGLTIVQDPLDAEVPTMPAAAIARSKPDHVLPLRNIPPMLLQLAAARNAA